MAARRTGKVAAPVKMKLRKHHGPKRHMFKDLKPMTWAFAKSGILSKYSCYESFELSCASRGVKNGVPEMWSEFKILPRIDQDKYLANIKENALAAMARIEKRKKAAKKSA